MPLLKEKTYTIDDIYALPEGERAELIDGHMYMMAPPSRKHQRISTRLVSIIDRYIGCKGAPDWVIEIVSPASKQMDYYTKLFKYRIAGIREYWIVDPSKNLVVVYNFELGETEQYTLQDSIKVGIYDELVIDFGSIEL